MLPSPEKLLRTPAVATQLDVSPGTLRQWRMAGRGPEFVKIGGAIRYTSDAVNRYVANAAHVANHVKVRAG